MASAEHLTPEQLGQRCDPAEFDFRTTAELPDTTVVLGQERAVAATQFGIGIRREGYNLFVFGPPGTGKHTIVRSLLEQQAAREPTPCDCCYVNNFEQNHRPRLLTLPSGRGAKFRDDMARLIEDLRTAVTTALETDEYRVRQEEIEQEFHERRDHALADLRDRAAQHDIALIRTPVGLALGPAHQGQIMEPEAFERLPEDQRAHLRSLIVSFEEELEKILHQVPKWQRERREKLQELKRAIIRAAVDALIDELRREYEGEAGVQAYLSTVQKDVVENAEDIRRTKDGEETGPLEALMAKAAGSQLVLSRYQVNVLDDRGHLHGAPVIAEDNPSYHNLTGRIEHVAHMGTLMTDFTLIKPGALHRANGGYLMLDARRVLLEPFAWEGLKRALRSRELRIESLGQALSLVSTVSLEPEPIPLSLKVVLIGDRLIYYLLYALDPDFKDLFKVAVDFEDRMDRGGENQALYAGLVAMLAKKQGLRPLTAAGVSRVIDHAARLAGDATKLSVGVGGLTDLLREADYWAGVNGHDASDAADVQRAIDAQIHRAGRPRDRLQEEIARGTIAITTEGGVTGQINGLSVAELGGFAFARPSRITARVRLGRGTVVDIEREVALGGPIHSKGVLILTGFLAGRYIPDQPLSLAASIVFEQSYGLVEGDSASSAELYALLSALADVPLKQSLAVTGSVNQRGEIQAVGGVNEKVEGFFDLCKAKGLSGDHGVLIPATNKPHLMLRDDVVQAVREGKFQIYAVETIDQGIELLTGLPAGERDGSAGFPEGSINRRVEQRLVDFARQARAFGAAAGVTGEEPQTGSHHLSK